jgi:hypothetical protein
MAALFPRWSTPVFRAALATLAGGAAIAFCAPMIYVRTRFAPDQGDPLEQPIAFDHRHHVRDDGIDCVYCHETVETQAQAGFPPTERCMGCHVQVWPDSPKLEPLRTSWATRTPLRWRRLNALPAYVYFHHGVHVRAGVPCARCHGEVEEMARTWRQRPLTMSWCLECHRAEQGSRDITRITTCTACHR